MAGDHDLVTLTGCCSCQWRPIEVIDQLADRDIEFRSLTEGFDTSTSGGRLIFLVFAAVAEFERHLVRERTRAGLEAAKRQGRTGERPSVMTSERLEAARLMRNDGHSLRAIGAALDVSPTTVSRHLRVTNHPNQNDQDSARPPANEWPPTLLSTTSPKRR